MADSQTGVQIRSITEAQCNNPDQQLAPEDNQKVDTLDQHTRDSWKTKHWVYKQSKFHITSEVAVVISVKHVSVKMSRWHILQNRIISSNVLSSEKTNCKNDIQ